LWDSGEGRVARPLPPQAHMSTLLPEAVHRPQGSVRALFLWGPAHAGADNLSRTRAHK